MKHYYSLLAACMLLFSGCSETFVDQGATPPQPTNPDGHFEARIHAGTSTDDATRALYDGTHVRWEVGDRIGLGVGENDNIEFTLIEETLSEDARSADFTGVLTHEVTGVQDVWAAYPYISGLPITSSEMIVLFPRDQTSLNDIQFTPIALAHYRGDVGEGLERVNLQFYNPFTTLKLEITVDAETTFHDILFQNNNGEGFPTIARFALGESGAVFDSSYEDGYITRTHIKVDCGDLRVAANSTATFYITVPPLDYSEGYAFNIVTDRGVATQIKPSQADYTSKVNTVLSLPVFTLDPQPYPMTVIPDTDFRKFMFEKGYIDRDAEGVVQITPDGFALAHLNISEYTFASLEGIAAFPNLEVLDAFNSALTSLDLSGCTTLKHVWCHNSPNLTALDVTGCSALEQLICTDTSITTLDVTGCPALEYLECHNCSNLASLDVTDCPALSYLSCYDSPNLSTLDVSGCAVLQILDCHNTNLSTLDVTGNPALEQLGCWNTPITTLNITDCSALVVLYCNNTNLSSLDVTGCPALELLYCNNTNLSSLDVTGCGTLKKLTCNDTNLSSLDVSENPMLEWLNCANTSISSIDVSGCLKLRTLWIRMTGITTLDVSMNTELWQLSCADTSISSLDVTGCPALELLFCNNCHLSELDLSNMVESPYIAKGTISLTCGNQKDESGNPRELTLTAPAWLSKYWSDGLNNWGSLPENQGVVLK